MDDSQRERLLLQELWRQRLACARSQFEAAKAGVEAASQLQSQAPLADRAHLLPPSVTRRSAGGSSI
jgi:hypothetical protein